MIGHVKLSETFSSILLKGWGINASLFHGPCSVGKRTASFELSKKLLCLEGGFEDCICNSCKKFNNDHPDFLSIGIRDRLKVSDIDSVHSFISTAPFISRRRVVVIDNAETMTVEASNRLLKTLEEPPEKVTFFLISSNPSGILPTIRSRCVSFKFGTLSQEDYVNIIWKKLGFDLPQSKILGWIASVTSSDVFRDAGNVLKLRDSAMGFIPMLMSKDSLNALDYVDRIEKEDLPWFIDLVIILLTDILMAKEGLEIVNNDLRDKIEGLVKKINPLSLVASISHLSQSKKGVSFNTNLSLSLKATIFKINPLLKTG